MTFPCRVMRLDVDPTHPDDLFACIEANGTMRRNGLSAGGRWIRTSGSARDRGLVSRFRFAPELMATNGSRR